MLTDTYRRVEVEELPDVRVLVPVEPERLELLELLLRVLVPVLVPVERVLVLFVRAADEACVRLVLVVPELRTRVVVVLLARVEVAGCDFCVVVDVAADVLDDCVAVDFVVCVAEDVRVLLAAGSAFCVVAVVREVVAVCF